MHNVTKGIILIKKFNSFNIKRNKQVYYQGLNQPQDRIITQVFLAPNPAGTSFPKCNKHHD